MKSLLRRKFAMKKSLLRSRLQMHMQLEGCVNGVSYAKLNIYNEAIDDYNKAIRLNTNNTYIYKICGVSYIKRSIYNEAIGDYNKTIELN
jgi:tetratricopeptide (TPR) repeat protein